MRAFSMRHAVKCQGAASYHAFSQPVLSDLFVVWSGVHVSCTSHQLDRSRSPKMHCIHLLVKFLTALREKVYCRLYVGFLRRLLARLIRRRKCRARRRRRCAAADLAHYSHTSQPLMQLEVGWKPQRSLVPATCACFKSAVECGGEWENLLECLN